MEINNGYSRLILCPNFQRKESEPYWLPNRALEATKVNAYIPIPPGVATNAESNGSGRNGSEGAARGRSRSPGPGVQVAEVARAAAQRQLSVKLMELEAAATRADQMGDTEEVLR
jgi:hypothetical protein